MLKEFHKVTELNNSLNQTETFSKYFCKKVRVGHCVILRSAHNVLLHSFKERNILFSNFLLLMKPKRTLRSFEKKAGSLKKMCVLLKRMRVILKERIASPIALDHLCKYLYL